MLIADKRNNASLFTNLKIGKLLMSRANGISCLYSTLPVRFNLGNQPCQSKMAFKRPNRLSTKICASYDRNNYHGKLVDEDMIALRIRIHDMKMIEKHDHDQPPSNWMKWEKQYYANYKSDIYEAVGLLQTQLMNTRPCLALGMLALITLSLPMSTVALLDIFRGMMLANGIHF